eukprot:TRINITY_DN6525_c2_g1_i1.p1 TRINITY_DN6525_c2_g1~~TRINITY_DN6525_c2_g1_i1.p1  ORF type:complete len:771 (+),score=220.92 TRINITY_DN6525_c2_g1_i1:271-2313(+)
MAARVAACVPCPAEHAAGAGEWLRAAISKAAEGAAAAEKTKAKAKEAAGALRYVPALSAAARAFCVERPDRAQPLVAALWGLAEALPRGQVRRQWRGARHVYAALSAAACALPGGGWLRGGGTGLMQRCRESSVAAAELAAAARSTVADPVVLAELIVYSPSPEARPLHARHPAAALCPGGAGRLCPGAGLLTAVLAVDEGGPDAVEGSETHMCRLRKWWAACSLLAQLDPAAPEDAAAAEAAAGAAIAELRLGRALPRTRVLVQNALARAVAAAPERPGCGGALCAQTDTRLAVSAVAVAAQLLLLPQLPPAGGSTAAPPPTQTAADCPVPWSGLQRCPDGGLRRRLLGGLAGWAYSLPHQSRVLAQIALREALGDAAEGPALYAASLPAVLRFMDSNPHLAELQREARLRRLVSEYVAEPLAFDPPPPSVDTVLQRALRSVQRRYGELEGATRDEAHPSAGKSGARRCPAAARGRPGGAGAEGAEDEDGESGSDAAPEGAPAHQQRPAPSRGPRTAHGEPSICVVGSFLDNTPNQAGLSRTLEALFGGAAELVLPSLKVLREPGFLRMSMASERWLRCVEVPPGERLEHYIRERRRSGYQIVALEQTDRSVSACDFSFSKRCVIVVGNESLGLPAWLLQRDELVDVYVELPLGGASRSLNAHVTAAMMMWQFRMQAKG